MVVFWLYVVISLALLAQAVPFLVRFYFGRHGVDVRACIAYRRKGGVMLSSYFWISDRSVLGQRLGVLRGARASWEPCPLCHAWPASWGLMLSFAGVLGVCYL